MNLTEFNDNELVKFFMKMDKERKTSSEAERLYWNCVREINKREDLEKGIEHKDDEDMWIFLEKVIEVCNDASRGVDLIFQCPICNDRVIAYISPSNGHKHAKCMSCGMEVSA